MNSLLLRCPPLVFLLVAALLPLASRAADAPVIPIEQFFRHPAISSPQLSPSGKLIAVLAPSSAKDGRVTLAVAAVETPQKLTVAAHFEDADVRDFHWVSDERLVFGSIDLQSALGEQVDEGLYAVNADGTDFVWLIGRRYGDQDAKNMSARPLRWNHAFFSTLRDGSDDVVIERYESEGLANKQSSSLLRLNTKTRALREFKLPSMPVGARGWVLDRAASPQPRAVLSVVKDQVRVLWRDDKGGDWIELAKFDAFGAEDRAFIPEAFDADGQLYVVAEQDNPEHTKALYRYDAVHRQREDKPILSLKGFDFAGALIFDRRSDKLLGASYLTDARGVEWFDPALKAVQGKLDKLLPGTVNLCGGCSNSRRSVVTAYSDRQTAVYFLYDPESDKLQLIGAARPWMDAARASEVDFDRFSARDGLSVPVYVTRPKGKGPWPAVIMVHGGPNVRGGEWGWSREAQFLASRGYVVVEPEYRGSTGFGSTLFRAGWKQWGLAMQDDITDATLWAIKKGLADPKRIALAGASYGGYATMMGLVKEPDLYRAGINWVGVTDIKLMYDIGWSDFAGGDWQRYGMPRLIGDPDKDAVQLTATSPLQQAARITKPVLMAYGGKDRRVPLPHGTRMRDALKKSGKADVEWVEYDGEGHGWLLVENQVDFWERVEAFLAKNLK